MPATRPPNASPLRHDARGPTGLRPVHELVSRLWGPGSRWHIGDVAWSWATDGAAADRDAAWWELNGAPVAWAWTEGAGELAGLVDPAHPDLTDHVLAWFDAVEVPGAREVTVMRGDLPWTEALTRHGYREVSPDGPFFEHLVRDLTDLPDPGPPAGFVVRPLDPYSERDVSARAAVHRAAFDHLVWDGVPAPGTGLTVRSAQFGSAGDLARRADYRRVMGTWPYRPDLDLVAESGDGLVVSYCLTWLDEYSRTGLLEPVGTDPGFRRLGLARAVCVAAMHALRAAGAERALVCPRGDAHYPVPGRLYRALGFVPHGRTVTWERQPRAASSPSSR